MYPPAEAGADQPDDFQIAVQAMTRAVRAINAGDRGGDGAEFVTHVVAAVAANLGSSHAVTQARPGSWEADKVSELLASTVGYDDEYLMGYRTEPVALVVNADFELDGLGLFMTYEASADHIAAQMFGDRAAAVTRVEPGGLTMTVRRGQLTGEELEQMEPIDELLYVLEEAERVEYRRRFTETVEAEFERLRSESPMQFPDHLSVNVRYTDDYDDLTEVWTGDLASRLYEHALSNTPLPGSDSRPDHTIGQRYAQTLLDAGHWPHLRIPELAHYGAPTRNTTTSDTTDKEN